MIADVNKSWNRHYYWGSWIWESYLRNKVTVPVLGMLVRLETVTGFRISWGSSNNYNFYVAYVRVILFSLIDSLLILSLWILTPKRKDGYTVVGKGGHPIFLFTLLNWYKTIGNESISSNIFNKYFSNI